MGNPCGYGVTVAEKSVRHAADAWYIGYVMASTIKAASALVSFKGY